ncbi:hypothetical protein FOZ60_000869 [Perkinsus olseni]|uniref:Uncharacterized protein n=1 Tax=Perkinsus olseni TaxID=32597 RepID=A0A7J6PKA0_PEROL|nr:hypothetical protein FOZ60_000869 [Perkinsus olseni]
MVTLQSRWLRAGTAGVLTNLRRRWGSWRLPIPIKVAVIGVSLLGGYVWHTQVNPKIRHYWWSNRSAKIAKQKFGLDGDLCHFYGEKGGVDSDLQNIRRAAKARVESDEVDPSFTMHWETDAWLRYGKVLWRVGHFPSSRLACDDPLPEACDRGWCLVILPGNDRGFEMAQRMSEVTDGRFEVKDSSVRPSMNPDGESLLSRLDLVGFGILGQSKICLDRFIDFIFALFSGGAKTPQTVPRTDGCPLVVFLPSFAEHYASRQVPMSLTLASRGICGMILLENPLRGRRAPPPSMSLHAECMHSVDQFLAFAARSVSDTRGLLHWIDSKIHPDRLCVGGLSIGASIATMSAVTLRNLAAGLSLCAFFPASSASSTWTHERSAMRPYVNPKLDRGYIEEATAATDITTYPKPTALSSRVELLGARHDAIILGENTRRLSEYLDCPIRWVRGGHVTGALLQQHEFIQAITRAVS